MITSGIKKSTKKIENTAKITVDLIFAVIHDPRQGHSNESNVSPFSSSRRAFSEEEGRVNFIVTHLNTVVSTKGELIFNIEHVYRMYAFYIFVEISNRETACVKSERSKMFSVTYLRSVSTDGYG